MKRWPWLVVAVLLSATVAPAAWGDTKSATIRLGRGPQPPSCIQNPDGIEDISWEIQHTTTPLRVEYFLQDPPRTTNLEHQTYPDDTGLIVARSWTVPPGLPDGKYWIRVEYWSWEAGLESTAEVTFYVCTESGDLCGKKQEDTDCDGVLGPTDPPVSDWLLCFRAPNGDQFCPRTDGQGEVCLSNIPLGLWAVYEVPVAGWHSVGPDSFTVNVVDHNAPWVYLLNVRDDYCTGACCYADGHCTVQTATACQTAGGTYQGDNTACSPNPCPQPLGACCYADGHCTVLTAAACQAAGGTFQGDNTVCSPNPCPQPQGACCYADGHCTVQTATACEAAGGTYQGDNAACSPNPCPQPQGACCYADGHCIVRTAAACQDAGGTYQGDYTACSPNPCPQPLGACCSLVGTCTVLTAAACQAAGGAYAGDGTNCFPNPCTQLRMGACCYSDGRCALQPSFMCLCFGGMFIGNNTSCSPDPCPQESMGACCYAEQPCTVQTAAACQAAGGSYQGDDTTCDPDPCAGPSGACCSHDGSCTALTRDACLAHDGTYQGDDTTCNPSPCPWESAGACCFAEGLCTFEAAGECLAAGGMYLGDRTHCDTHPCPQLPCTEFCSLIQEEYGNAAGMFRGESRLSMLRRLVTSESPIVIGKPGQSVTFLDGSEECIIDRLPAGGEASDLPAVGDAVVDPTTCNSSPDLPLWNDRFLNSLVGETIALSLNIRLDPCFATAGACQYMVTAGEDLDIQYTIPQSVLAALSILDVPATISGILDLANRTLAHGAVGGASAADVSYTVEAMNNAFDQCRTLRSCSSEPPSRSPGEPEIQPWNPTPIGADGELRIGLSPNPVHASASMRIDLPEDSRLRLSMYDVSGQEIDVMELGIAPKGEFTLLWNPRDAGGEPLPPGVYFYRVDALGLERNRHLTSCQKFLVVR